VRLAQRLLPRSWFYGWVIVAVVMVCDFVQSQETFPILAIMLKPITEEFGWSRTAFVLPVAGGTVAGGFIGALLGPRIDRWGPRWVTAGAFAALGTLLMAMAWMQELWQYNALQVAARALTHGVIGLTLVVVVPKWFVVQRGRAVALSGLGNRGGQFAMPPVALFLVRAAGWRWAALLQGAIVWVLAVLPAALLLRREPEDVGLLPDGMSRAEWQRRQALASTGGDDLDVAVTPREALRSRAFYLLTLAGMGSPFAAAGLNLHLFPYLTDSGIPETTAVAVVSTWLATNVVGSLLVGFLAERFTSRRVTLWSYALAAGPVLALPFIHSAPAAFAYALVQGVGQGGSLALRLLWADYFGRRHQGAIRGMTLPAQNVAIASGPITGALVFDLTGGYAQAFTAFGVSLLLACVAIFLARPPKG
jgi:MFS family permease